MLEPLSPTDLSTRVAEFRYAITFTVQRYGVDLEKVAIGLGFPFKYPTGPVPPGVIFRPKTEAEWHTFPWNPFSWDPLAEPDPRIPAKMPWADLLVGLQLYEIKQLSFGTKPNDPGHKLLGHADAIANAAISHSGAASDVHVGEGIGHMPALIYLGAKAKSAGEAWPPTVLRDVGGKHVDIWTDVEAEELLDQVARNKNHAESARNLVYNKGIVYLNAAFDEHGGLATTASDADKLTARMNAAEQFRHFAEHIPAHYAQALKDVEAKAGELPEDDLPRAKRTLIRQLESDAMRKIKDIRGAVSQQRIDMPPACRDMGDAEDKVAEQEQVGALQILRADTVDDAKRQYDIFKARIENVKPYRVPEFRTTGHTTNFPTPKAKFAQREYALTVWQPPLPVGVVAVIWGFSSLDATVTKVRQTDNEIDLKIVLTGNKAVSIAFDSYNICGHNRFTLTLEPPAEDE